ncbi:MAG: Catechol 1,2-dioxygenase 1 [Chloroflexi bacterium]|nr:Catechol 1,2-dioxygenase 1 [Chloroflexota bacterium]
MDEGSQMKRSRRGFLHLGLVAPVAAALGASGWKLLQGSTADSPVSAQILEPTPACDENPSATPPQTEGPYFKRTSPERQSLLDEGIGGTRLIVAGYVLTRQCQPVAGALLDFWQADDAGVYDNAGYRLRGHQFTDDTGRFRLETVVPGLYPGRTTHIHVKVQPAGGSILTTQLYFPDEPRNRTDSLYRTDLLMPVQDTDIGKSARFNFVLG